MKFVAILLLSGFYLFPFACNANAFDWSLPSYQVSSDSSKYRGYRLELTNFKLLKEKGDWIKISFTAVNSGRMDIDMGKEGTSHWVLINFDQSIFSEKLGGYRDNIRYQLAEERFSLAAGKTKKEVELKVPSVIIAQPPGEEPTVEEESPDKEKPTAIAWEKPSMPSLPAPSRGLLANEKPCPDILITDLQILEEDDKWATVQYTFANQGEGVFYLYGNANGKKDNLVINAYISGVKELTRGAIPIGGQIFPESEGRTNELLKGDSITAQLKLDVRKKTRYMKCLILSLDSNQFADECDRINNHMGVVLR